MDKSGADREYQISMQEVQNIDLQPVSSIYAELSERRKPPVEQALKPQREKVAVRRCLYATGQMIVPFSNHTTAKPNFDSG